MAEERVWEKVSNLTESDKDRKMVLSYWDFVTLKNLETENRNLNLEINKRDTKIRELIQAFKEEDTTIKLTLDYAYDDFIIILGKGELMEEVKKDTKAYRELHEKRLDKLRKEKYEAQNEARQAREKVINLKRKLTGKINKEQTSWWKSLWSKKS